MAPMLKDWIAFLYGNTCVDAESEDGNGLSPLVARARKIMKQAAKATGSVAVAAALYGSLEVQIVDAAVMYTNMSSPQVHSFPGVVIPELRRDFIAARAILKASQEEVSAALQLSLPTVQKFEQGWTGIPEDQTIERYRALIRLASIYHVRFGSKEYLINFYLHEPSELYDGLSAMQFAATRDDGIFTVLGTESRRHA